MASFVIRPRKMHVSDQPRKRLFPLSDSVHSAKEISSIIGLTLLFGMRGERTRLRVALLLQEPDTKRQNSPKALTLEAVLGRTKDRGARKDSKASRASRGSPLRDIVDVDGVGDSDGLGRGCAPS
jgi:hypothetical protein